MSRFAWLAILVLVAFPRARGAEAPTTLPAAAPAGLEPALWRRMKQVDAKAADIHSLTADFEQVKQTPLLKKPLVSKGTVAGEGEVMRWDTTSPQPTVMRVDQKQIEIYYPDARTLEVYPIESRLSEMASSPIPRLGTLLPHFSFAPAPADAIDGAGKANLLALLMTPIDPAVKEHVQSVIVLIDTERAFILSLRLTDPDGEQTEIRFSNVKTNLKLDPSRLEMKIPQGTKVVHPLEGAPRH